MRHGILTINAGSSSIKFALFDTAGGLAKRPALSGQIDGLGAEVSLKARDEDGAHLPELSLAPGIDHEDALAALLRWLPQAEGGEGHWQIAAVGHRVVHGGEVCTEPARVTPELLTALEAFCPLAPLHQPHNLAGVRALAALMPEASQVVCFDTAFHSQQAAVARDFGLPRALTDSGIKRYGFHGISYEFIARRLPQYTTRAEGRVVVAHLGNGASLCALQAGQSVATTMGFTVLDGLVMGTRTGNIDPGVILYLLESRGLDAAALTHLLYHESGLLGVSGISQDMRTLLASEHPAASEAIELFCYRAIREIGSLAAALGGIDALVFCGGIGEHAGEIRRRIVEGCAWLGATLDADSNRRAATRISTAESHVEVLIIPTDEEWMIACHTAELLGMRV
ncbi:acetate/propionate family kinase [Rhodocyclus tenuis]|uniref:Acetate kinase n=1 Tax=Rhodocyclus gracilis TaxID=2929842 RepID=A0ABX0WJA8_9RHOO|nr:acetate/propionate family kinase [Rhodocyclus gracilis]NJA88684.1 acetate/propionate family kinase [Rhodocyclus gracilis]